jgi:hypothetical protein
MSGDLLLHRDEFSAVNAIRPISGPRHSRRSSEVPARRLAPLHDRCVDPPPSNSSTPTMPSLPTTASSIDEPSSVSYVSETMAVVGK